VTAAPIHLAGERLMLDPGGALLWPERRVMVVSDLHFEKGSAAARRGSLLPPWDTHATLDRLTVLLRRHRPETVVALGDSFHDLDGPERMRPQDRARLTAMTAAANFIWVMGNHDAFPVAGLGGVHVDEWHAGPLQFRHQAAGAASGDVSGHFHPKAAIATSAALISRPCFVFDGRRLMLPAIGAYAGGLDVRDPAIAGLFPRGGRVFLLGRERLFTFPFAAGRARTAI